jgi:GH3 auxin-responsive promoter
MKLSASLLNAAWVAAQYRGYRQFRQALRHPQAEQETRLFHYLRSNANTEFGLRHGFGAIRSVVEFQDRVPLSSYGDYEREIRAIRAGERNVLTAADVRCLEPSGGSTRAAKLIPYTADLQTEFGRALAPWIVDLARSTPAILGGPAYWSITPAMSESPSDTAVACAGARASDRTAIGFESDSAYLGGWLQWLTERTLIACDDLKHATDLAQFQRHTLVRLVGERELRLISVWHPSFLTLLLDALATSWDDVLHAVASGLPSMDGVRGTPPNRSRARELAKANPHRPATLWPHLAVISCWGDGHASTLIADVQSRFPATLVQPKGLIATEAFISLPFAGLHPLAVRSHFFEFIDTQGRVRLPWQLEPGATYSVVITTGGGLYRYQLRDRISVECFLHGTPCIRFIGKEDSVCDLRGEKLSEGLVASVLSRLLPALAPGTSFALLAPESDGVLARYVLYIATPDAPASRLAEAVERELAFNPQYALCVRLGQLQPVIVARVDPSAGARYLHRLREQGQRLGNIKPAALSPLTGWRETFGC